MSIPKRIKIECAGNLWATIVTDLATGAILPVAGIRFECDAENVQAAAVHLTIPAHYCTISLEGEVVDIAVRHLDTVPPPCEGLDVRLPTYVNAGRGPVEL